DDPRDERERSLEVDEELGDGVVFAKGSIDEARVFRERHRALRARAGRAAALRVRARSRGLELERFAEKPAGRREKEKPVPSGEIDRNRAPCEREARAALRAILAAAAPAVLISFAVLVGFLVREEVRRGRRETREGAAQIACVRGGLRGRMPEKDEELGNGTRDPKRERAALVRELAPSRNRE